MCVAKEEGIATDSVEKKVSIKHNFDGGRLFQMESAFWGKPVEALSFAHFS